MTRFFQAIAPRCPYGFAGVTVLFAISIAVLMVSPFDETGVAGDSTARAAMQSQKCVLCSRAFADKLAQLCSTCDKGKCFKCGAAFPTTVARVCSTCHKDKCINCGRAFPDKAAKLCNTCAR